MHWPHSNPPHMHSRVPAISGVHRGARALVAVLGLCVAMLVAAPVAAKDAPTWVLDPVHTRVMFAVSHAGFSNALGTISGSTGTLQFDPDDWQRTRLDATVPLERLDLGDPSWNRATLATRLLDAQTHPSVRFTSDSAIATEPSQGLVCGELSLHGVTRPLCMDVTVNAIKRHPMPPFRRTAGFSATAVLSRSDYGIDAWPSVIGDEVTIRIEAEAVRSHTASWNDHDKDDDAEADDPSATPPSTSTPEPGAHQ